MYILFLTFCLLPVYLGPTVNAYSLTHYQFSANSSLPKELTIGEGEALFLYWRPTEKSLTKCTVKNPRNKLINLFEGSQGNYITSNSLTFEDGYCCVKIRKVTASAANGTWSLHAESMDQHLFDTNTVVKVQSSITNVNRSFTFLEDTSNSFLCGYENAIYCQLTTPKKNVIKFGGPCKMDITANANDHEGIWLCSFSVSDFVINYIANVEINVIEDETKELDVKEFRNEIVFYCKSKKHSLYNKFCKITTPYGLDLYLSPGKAYGRYTYYGSNASYCGVTIPKPLASYDMGSWRCQLVNSFTGIPEIYGGYKTIGSSPLKKSVETESNKVFWTNSLAESHILLCHVPYSIKYCWFKGPDGKIYNIDNKIYIESSTLKIKSQGFKFGDCAISFVYANATELTNSMGNWTCNIGINVEFVEELKTTIEIIYSDVPIIPTNKEVVANLGATVNIGCKNGNGRGISYCRFIRPDGIGLSVDPNTNNSLYSYYGKGFLYGECGITIHKLESHDNGKWTCSAQLMTLNPKAYSTEITLKTEKGSALAVYIFVGLGCFLSLVGISYFIIRKFEINIKPKSREHNERLIDTEENPVSDDSINQLQSGSERINDVVTFVRRRSPRPTTLAHESTYI